MQIWQKPLTSSRRDLFRSSRSLVARRAVEQIWWDCVRTSGADPSPLTQAFVIVVRAVLRWESGMSRGGRSTRLHAQIHVHIRMKIRSGKGHGTMEDVRHLQKRGLVGAASKTLPL